MNTIITFVVPVRHQDDVEDWPGIKATLSQTMASIAGQSHPAWRAVLVANEGADLPALPDGFEVVWVNFPSNRLDPNARDREALYQAVRLDKGRRVLAGMLSRRDTQFYMIVDYDDFVSKELVGFVAKNPGANGWKLGDGYVWADGGRLLFLHDDFSTICGTCLIVRADLYDLPPDFASASDEYVRAMLGSHRKIGEILAQKNTPLAPLPFRGATYRIGHAGGFSRHPGIIELYCLNRKVLARPHKWLRNISRLRLVNDAFRKEFFG